MAIGHGEKLTRKQEQAIAALLTSPTVTAAAEAVGVSEKTLRSWMAGEAFDAAYRAARRQVVDHATTQLQRLCRRAVRALAKALRDANVQARIRAATVVLEMAFRGVEVSDLAREVERLRQQMAEANHGGAGDNPPGGGEDAGGEQPPSGPTERPPPPGPPPSEPGENLHGGGADAGLLASGIAPLIEQPTAPPLFPAGR